MKQPVNQYRYTITNLMGASIVAPFGEGGATIQWNRENEDRLDYSKSFPNKIIFKESVFNSLYTIERSLNRCDLMILKVERNCGGVWNEWFAGRFTLMDALWNPYRCEVEIKLQKFEPGQCLEDNKATEINLFSFGITQTVLINPIGVIVEKVEYQQLTTFPNLMGRCTPDEYWGGGGTAAAGAWIAYYHEYRTELQPGASFTTCFKYTKWARQKLVLPVADPSPGPDWILIGTSGGNNTWARPAVLFNCVSQQITAQGNTLFGTIKSCEVLEPGINSVNEIDNGLKLADVLQAFLTSFCSGMTVKSQFFQINPDTMTATNYVTGLASKVLNIIVNQKSDVKRPAVSGNAVIAMLSFEKLMSYLRAMFNVRYRVVGNVLRVEHLSWFSKSAGLDLTTQRYEKNVYGLTAYSYKSEEIPQREEFKFMEASAGDFAGVPIIYNSGCVSQEGKDVVKQIIADRVTTDLELVLSNPDPKSSVVSDDGFVFIATSPSFLVLTEAPILSAKAKLNNTLAWAQLHRDYHKYGRPLSSGIMNNVQTNFLSTEPKKKGVPLKVPLCCDDVFNPDDLVTTALGQGTVDKATFSLKDSMITLELLYPADDNLYVPAVANGDVVAAGAGVTTNFNVVANDVPGTAAITLIEIVLAPLHGTVSVIAGPQIAYTPTGGYTGSDNFVYRVLDATGFPSNNALVAITVS
jgi:hypothetical protein